MILSKIELSESTVLDFGIDIFGTSESAQQARLVIEGPQFDISCRCIMENGEVKATVPKLKGILQSGVYETRLEIVVGDKLFIPLKEQIELNPLIEFDVKTKKVETVKEGVKITVKTVTEDSKPAATSKLEKNIQMAIKEGFEVSQVGDHYIMKKGDQYCGLISESKILKAKQFCASLTELIDSLS